MTLDELRRTLDELAREVPGDTLVVQSSDPEGNGHAPVDGFSISAYHARTEGVPGDVYPLPGDPEAPLVRVPHGWVRAVVLWPRA